MIYHNIPQLLKLKKLSLNDNQSIIGAYLMLAIASFMGTVSLTKVLNLRLYKYQTIK